MRLLMLLALSTLTCGAATWTYDVDQASVSDATCGRQQGFAADVVFTDNSPTPVVRTTNLFGLSIASIVRQAEREKARLEDRDSLATTEPTPPTGRESAISNILQAARRLRALNEYVALVGADEADQIGTSGVTVAARRAQLVNAIQNNITAGGHVNQRLLDPWELAQ